MTELRRAAPYAILLAGALGAVVVAGAHLSNAFPSESRPYGWTGPSGLENAVAMVRSDLVLATSIPALLLGARALARHEPGRDGAGALLATFGIHGALLALAVGVAALIGAWGASKAPGDAIFAFWVAHSVLALSFYSIAFLFSALLREHAIAAAAAVWLAFLGLYEAITRTILFRTEGYHNLAGGAFPDWFWVTQGLSPLSSYTGILILWRPGFREYLEKAALEGAALPGWLVPATFVGLALVLWVAIPLSVALAGWAARGRTRRRDTPSGLVSLVKRARAP